MTNEQDFKSLIEKKKDQLINQWVENNISDFEPPHLRSWDARIARGSFNQGAKLPSELLLKALSALEQIANTNYYSAIVDADYMERAAKETLSEIRKELEK